MSEEVGTTEQCRLALDFSTQPWLQCPCCFASSYTVIIFAKALSNSEWRVHYLFSRRRDTVTFALISPSDNKIEFLICHDPASRKYKPSCMDGTSKKKNNWCMEAFVMKSKTQLADCWQSGCHRTVVIASCFVKKWFFLKNAHHLKYWFRSNSF